MLVRPALARKPTAYGLAFERLTHRGGGILYRAEHRRVCRGELLERNSDSSDDDLDSALSIELRHRNDPQYLAKAAKRLDVVWSVSAKKVVDCPSPFISADIC